MKNLIVMRSTVLVALALSTGCFEKSNDEFEVKRDLRTTGADSVGSEERKVYGYFELLAAVASFVAADNFTDPDALPAGALQRFGSERLSGTELVALSATKALLCRGNRWTTVRADGMDVLLPLPSPAALGSLVDRPPDSCPPVVANRDGTVHTTPELYDDTHRNSGHSVGIILHPAGHAVQVPLPKAGWWRAVEGGFASAHEGGGVVDLSGANFLPRNAKQGELRLLPGGRQLVTDAGGVHVPASNGAPRLNLPSGRSVSVSATTIAVVDSDVVHSFDLRTGRKVFSTPGSAVVASDDGFVVISGCPSADAVFVDWLGSVRRRVRLSGAINCGDVHLSPDGAALSDGNSLWRLQDGAEILRRRMSNGRWTASPSGKTVVHLAATGIEVWKGNRRRHFTFEHYSAPEMQEFGSPDWHEIVVLSDQVAALVAIVEMRVINLATGSTVCHLDIVHGRLVDLGGRVALFYQSDTATGEPFVDIIDSKCHRRPLRRGGIYDVQQGAGVGEVEILVQTGKASSDVELQTWTTARGYVRSVPWAPKNPDKGLSLRPDATPAPLPLIDMDSEVIARLTPHHLLVKTRRPSALWRSHGATVGPPQPVPDTATSVVRLGKDRVLVPVGGSALVFPLPSAPSTLKP